MIHHLVKLVKLLTGQPLTPDTDIITDDVFHTEVLEGVSVRMVQRGMHYLERNNLLSSGTATVLESYVAGDLIF